MGRMIFPQGGVPILSNPNGYRDDTSVVSSITDMFQARKQMREGNEQQVAAVFEQEAQKLDPETRQSYYKQFVQTHPEAAKWLRGYDVQRPMTQEEQVKRMQNEATMGSFTREKQMAPGSVEQKVLDYVRQTGKNPTAAMIAEMVSRGTLTPQEYTQGVRVANGLAMSANQERQSADRRTAIGTGAATSRANTAANIASREGIARENREKPPKSSEGVKVPAALASLASDLKRLSDKADALRVEYDTTTGKGATTKREAIQTALTGVNAQIREKMKQFKIWKQKTGFAGEPPDALPRTANALSYRGPSLEPESEMPAPDEMMMPSMPEEPETHRLNQPDAPSPETHDLVYDENGNATWVPK